MGFFLSLSQGDCYRGGIQSSRIEVATRSNISKPFVYLEDVLYSKNENMNKNSHGSIPVPVFVQNVFHLIASTFLICACFVSSLCIQ